MLDTVIVKRRFQYDKRRMVSLSKEFAIPKSDNPLVTDHKGLGYAVVSLSKEDVFKALDLFNNLPTIVDKDLIPIYANEVLENILVEASPLHPVILDEETNIVEGQEQMMAHYYTKEIETRDYFVIYNCTTDDIWLREGSQLSFATVIAIATGCDKKTAVRLRETMRYRNCMSYRSYDKDSLVLMQQEAEQTISRSILAELRMDGYVEIDHLIRLRTLLKEDRDFIQWIARGLYASAYCAIANYDSSVGGFGGFDKTKLDYNRADAFIALLRKIDTDEVYNYYPIFGAKAVTQLKTGIDTLLQICDKLGKVARSNSPVINAQMSAIIGRFIQLVTSKYDAGKISYSPKLKALLDESERYSAKKKKVY